MLALTSVSGLLALGCGGDDPPAGVETADGTSSSGVELDASGTTAEPVPGPCMPAETRACYEGPPGTEVLGVCMAGQQACAADGSGWSECTGQVWPEPAERCDTPQDDDCDGSTVCEPVFEWSQTLPGLVTHVAGVEGGGAVVVGAGAYDDFQGETLEGTFVALLDAGGELSWSHSSGIRSYTWPTALAVDPASAIVMMGGYDGAPDLGGGPLPPAVFGYGGFAVRYGLGGATEWSFGFPCDGYHAAALGPDGTTYLVGGYVYGELEPEGGTADMHIMAVAPDGDVAWMLPGRGAWTNDPVSLVYLDHADHADELVLVAIVGGTDAMLGDLPTPASNYEALAVRIGLDGTPLGYERLLDPPPPTYDVRAIARPGGLWAAATVSLEEHPSPGGLLMGRDEALAPVSQSFLGPSTWLRSLAPHPDGTAILVVEFSGLLELGPIGVGLDGPAVAVVDDEGHGRWAEVLHADSGGFITWAAATPDGAVLVAGSVSELGGQLASGVVRGAFVAKLRP
jgi:hypothetical protein